LAMSAALEALSIACERFWRFCLVMRTHGAAFRIPDSIRIEGADVFRELADQLLNDQRDSLRRFDLMGLPKKLDQLSKGIGLKVRWADEVESVTKLRNCLIHRLGLVSRIDCNAVDSLRVSVRAPGLVLKSPDGRETDLRTFPVEVAGGSSIALKLDAMFEPEWAIGSRVALTERDIERLLFMILETGRQVLDGIRSTLTQRDSKSHHATQI